jgi:hypothetical protein
MKLLFRNIVSKNKSYLIKVVIAVFRNLRYVFLGLCQGPLFSELEHADSLSTDL